MDVYEQFPRGLTSHHSYESVARYRPKGTGQGVEGQSVGQFNGNDPWLMGWFSPWLYSAIAGLSSTTIDGAGEKSRRHHHLNRAVRLRHNRSRYGRRWQGAE
jgi:hypothetical protein